MIPYAVDISATVTGSAIKAVACEQCGTEYVYLLERSAEGSGRSYLFLDNYGASYRASQEAAATLQYKLARAVDAVPCPTCGRVQTAMIRRARRQYRRTMLRVGAVLTLVAIPFGVFALHANQPTPAVQPRLPWPALGVVVALPFFLGLGLVVAKWAMSRAFDPNDGDPEERIALGRSRTMLKAEYDAAEAAARAATAEIDPPPVREPIPERRPRPTEPDDSPFRHLT